MREGNGARATTPNYKELVALNDKEVVSEIRGTLKSAIKSTSQKGRLSHAYKRPYSCFLSRKGFKFPILWLGVISRRPRRMTSLLNLMWEAQPPLNSCSNLNAC